MLCRTCSVPSQQELNKSISIRLNQTYFGEINTVTNEVLSISYFWLLLVKEDAAILQGQIVKIVIASCEVFYATIIFRIHSEVLENCHFYVSAIFSNSCRPPSGI